MGLGRKNEEASCCIDGHQVDFCSYFKGLFGLGSGLDVFE